MLWFHLMFIGGCSTSIDLIWKVITLQTLWFISFGVFTPVPHGCQDWSILMPFWLKIDQSISFISARAWVLSAPRHASWFWIWTARRRRLRITEDLELRRSGWAECGSQSLRGSDAQVLGALARNWRCGGSVDPGGGHPWRSNGVTVPDMVGRRDHVERGFVDQCSYWTWSSDAAQLGIPSRALRQLHAGRGQGSPSGLHRVGHWEQLCQLGWGRSSRLGSPGFSALLVADAAGHISLICWHQGLQWKRIFVPLGLERLQVWHGSDCADPVCGRVLRQGGEQRQAAAVDHSSGLHGMEGIGLQLWVRRSHICART